MIETVRLSLLVTVVGGGLLASAIVPTGANAKRLISVVIVLAGIAWLLDALVPP
jgi:hypothetical protein